MKKTRQRSFKNQKEKDTTMTFRLESEFKIKYLKYCEENGYSYGKRLRLLMEKDLNNEQKIN